MKLIRFGDLGKERPGIITEESTRLDVSAFVADYDEAFFTDDGLSRLRRWLKQNAASALSIANRGLVLNLGRVVADQSMAGFKSFGPSRSPES